MATRASLHLFALTARCHASRCLVLLDNERAAVTLAMGLKPTMGARR